VLIPICWNGFAIKKWEGALLTVFYAAYVAYLILQAGDDGVPEVYRTMLLIVTPLVGLTFCVTGFQGWRNHRATQRS